MADRPKPHDMFTEDELRRRHQGAQSNPEHGINTDEEVAAYVPDDQ